ncbi:glycosyltransferase family 2 protein [Chloroflexus sp.]|uniref:glycosyltransferase family 2 protein n=1 Tax=Chloroflexus sp. TaxID=1904827 RepID=UPI00298F342F|nr:glycosyltransferase [Chloroflexus sp.]MDW8403660.1 glycosyltransferase [Chloroflexus sp.]
MTVSIIIPTLHSPIIGNVIRALSQQIERATIAEIIVVGLIDPSADIAPARLVTTPRSASAATARNIGARLATSDILLLIDSDCIAHPQLVASHLARHRDGHKVVGGSIAIEPNDNYWRLCDNLLSFTPSLATLPAGERPFLPSFNFSISRDIFTAMGGFDEQFRIGEDVDLSLRLRAHGHRLLFAPEAQVSHYPARESASAVARHLRSFGRVQVILHQRYQSLGRGNLLKRLRSWAGLLQAIAPCLALIDTMHLYYRYPPLRRYWHCLPGMVWRKSAWYWGYSEMLLIQAGNKHL